MFQNPIYLEMIRWSGTETPGTNTPLVTRERRVIKALMAGAHRGR
jgi:hypothetical protein